MLRNAVRINPDLVLFPVPGIVVLDMPLDERRRALVVGPPIQAALPELQPQFRHRPDQPYVAPRSVLDHCEVEMYVSVLGQSRSESSRLC